jgi:hypothetical protein
VRQQENESSPVRPEINHDSSNALAAKFDSTSFEMVADSDLLRACVVVFLLTVRIRIISLMRLSRLSKRQGPATDY